jgi:SAM-dependent methyltransferase
MKRRFARTASLCVVASLLSGISPFPFCSTKDVSLKRTETRLIRLYAKGGTGGGGFGAKPTAKRDNKSSFLKNIGKKHGGTSSEEIARGTQMEIEKVMQALPTHLKSATQLYQKLQIWDAKMKDLSILQQATIPQQEIDGAARARIDLVAIYSSHSISENDLHNIFQKATWDASADAKAARALTGQMPIYISERVQRASDIAGEALAASSIDGLCLDVGCGFGVLVPFLKRSGVAEAQIVGIDLSPHMIRNARDQYPGVRFEVCDFLSYLQLDASSFDAITFCAALHDMPDMIAALSKASSLLRPGGKLVLFHPQGASHVLNQSRSNPVLVKRGLPDSQELKSLDIGLQLTLAPAAANSPEESRFGYLAVLEKLVSHTPSTVYT